jgi:hypothetical protein
VKRFVVPPNWPTPPRRSWVPPKTWHPDPSWPPAPEGWRFWDDGKGNPVRGPVGRYGGTSRRTVFAGAGGLALFLAVNLWALSALGLFDGNQPSIQAAKVLDDSTPTPSVTATPKTTPPPTVPSAPPPVQKTTVKPSSTPTKTRAAKKTQSSEERNPTPTKTATRTVKPNRPTTTPPPTRDDVIREYCRQRGWDPDWCNPDNWPPDPNGPGAP